MRRAQTFVVESVQVEGEDGEFTRIGLQTDNTEIGYENMAEITILTDAVDTSDFKVGRPVRVSFDFGLQMLEP
jgi:hypothetical protein